MVELEQGDTAREVKKRHDEADTVSLGVEHSVHRPCDRHVASLTRRINRRVREHDVELGRALRIWTVVDLRHQSRLARDRKDTSFASRSQLLAQNECRSCALPCEHACTHEYAFAPILTELPLRLVHSNSQEQRLVIVGACADALRLQELLDFFADSGAC